MKIYIDRKYWIIWTIIVLFMIVAYLNSCSVRDYPLAARHDYKTKPYILEKEH
jgi:hypothetical protein